MVIFMEKNAQHFEKQFAASSKLKFLEQQFVIRHFEFVVRLTFPL